MTTTISEEEEETSSTATATDYSNSDLNHSYGDLKNLNPCKTNPQEILKIMKKNSGNLSNKNDCIINHGTTGTNHGKNKNKIDVGKSVQVYWSSDETYYSGRVIQKAKKERQQQEQQPPFQPENEHPHLPADGIKEPVHILQKQAQEARQGGEEQPQVQEGLALPQDEDEDKILPSHKHEHYIYSPKDNEYKYLIKYDDGYEEWIDLSKMKINLMDDKTLKDQQDRIREAKKRVARLPLHTKLMVWWPREKNYFPGVLDRIVDGRSGDNAASDVDANAAAVNDNHKPHHIQYDDGDQEWTDLTYRDFNIVQVGVGALPEEQKQAQDEKLQQTQEEEEQQAQEEKLQQTQEEELKQTNHRQEEEEVQGSRSYISPSPKKKPKIGSNSYDDRLSLGSVSENKTKTNYYTSVLQDEMVKEQETEKDDNSAKEAAFQRSPNSNKAEQLIKMSMSLLSEKKIDENITTIQKLHEIQVQKLMMECSSKGLSAVPADVVKPWRDKHFAQMLLVLKAENNSTLYDNDALGAKLCQAEADAIKAYTRELEKNRVGGQSQNQMMGGTTKLSPIKNDMNISSKANGLDQRSPLPLDQQQLALKQLLDRQELEQLISQQQLQQALEHKNLRQELEHQQARERQMLQQRLEQQQLEQQQLVEQQQLQQLQQFHQLCKNDQTQEVFNQSGLYLSLQNLSNSSQRQDINRNGILSLPNAELPNAQLPNAQLPNAQLPNTQLPNTQLPNTQLPNTQTEQQGLQMQNLLNSQTCLHQQNVRLNLTNPLLPNPMPLNQATPTSALQQHSLLTPRINNVVPTGQGQAAPNVLAPLLPRPRPQPQQHLEVVKNYTTSTPKKGGQSKSTSLTLEEIKRAQVGQVGYFDNRAFVNNAVGKVQQGNYHLGPVAEEIPGTEHQRSFDQAQLFDIPSVCSDLQNTLQQDSFDPVTTEIQEV